MVVIANLKKVRFNSSAMEDRTTRDVRSYLRGKTGAEGKSGYLRNEDFSSYIVLEITNTTNNKPYLIGVVFDYFHATGEEEHVFFRLTRNPSTQPFLQGSPGTAQPGEFFNYLQARGVKYQQYTTISIEIYDLRQLSGVPRNRFPFLARVFLYAHHQPAQFCLRYIRRAYLDVETMRNTLKTARWS